MSFYRCVRSSPALFALFLLAVSGARSGLPTAVQAADQVQSEIDTLAAIASGGASPRAIVVDSEFDAVRVSDAGTLNPSDAVTIELWVKRQSAAGCRTLVGKDRAEGYWFGLCDGRLSFASGGGATVSGVGTVPEGRWVHVAVAFDGSRLSFFIDGALDRTSIESRIPLLPNDAELVIGGDVSPGSFQPGLIDNVRIWSVARSAADIRDGRWRSLSAQPGLIAQWSFDGDLRDRVGGHDAVAHGAATFTFDGALPRDVIVPAASSLITVDGRCDATEYGTAARVAIDSPDAPTGLIQSTDRDLYICIDDMPRGTFQGSEAVVLLDRDLSADARVEIEDYRLKIAMRGTTTIEEGDGAGNFRRLELADSAWDIERLTEEDTWSAEFRISRSVLERPSDPDDLPDVGIAIGNLSARATGDDRFWPPGTNGFSPATWSVATLIDAFDPRPRTTFRGVVETVGGVDDPPRGIGGVTVRLYAVDESDDDEDPATVTLVDTDVTDGGGTYELVHRGRAPDAFMVQEVDPRGVLSHSADAGADGTAFGTNLLHYDADDAGRQPSTGRFVETLEPSTVQSLGQHYLIVYASPVEEGDLWPLIEAKRRQGFQVTTMAVSDIERQIAGRDTAERIREWLRSTWAAVEPEPVYALLVGRGDRIPVRDIGWLDSNHVEPGEPDYRPAWPTDWYYADVNSDWDADGDGFHGEFLRCRPDEEYDVLDPITGDAETFTCPEAGSLSREGPFGSLRGIEDDFDADIPIGRLAINDPAEVRRALTAVARAEASAGNYERRALVAGGFWSFEGGSWSEESSRTVPGGSQQADAWVSAVWDGVKPFGDDTAEHLETSLVAIISPLLDDVTRLYEILSPGGAPGLVPTRFAGDDALARISLDDRWSSGGYGLVNVAGNGAPDGVYTAHWLHDWDRNGRIDQPAPPGACAGRRILPLERMGPPCDELIPERVIDGGMSSPAGIAPIVIANAGETGAVAWSWDGEDGTGNTIGLKHGPATLVGTLSGRGAVSGWIGSMSSVRPGSLDGWQDSLNSQLLRDGRRLGDAVWRANGDLARSQPFDMRSYSPQLFGDPAMIYWGSPLDAEGAWPQDGRDWRATGMSSASGPTVPEIAWTAFDFTPSTPPVIGRDGELVVAGSGRVMRFSPGGRVSASADVSGSAATLSAVSPAITMDGAYVAAGAVLLSLDPSLSNRSAYTLPDGAVITGSPRVGPDGAVWLPTLLGMYRYSGDRASRIGPITAVVGTSAFTPDGAVAWATGAGRIEVYGFDGRGEPIQRSLTARGSALTSPSVGAAGTIYAGSTDGRLYAWPEDDLSWSVPTGGAIRFRPIVADEGTIIVVNDSGRVVALDAVNGAEIWARRLGGAPTAAPAVDGGHIYVPVGSQLLALHRATGDTAWQLNVGGALDARSAPVIGADRTLYLVRADRALIAIREAGWLAPPSSVTADARVPGRVSVTWRDNGGEAGFLVELCDIEGRCTEVGETAADVTGLDVDASDFSPGEPFYARVQALGPGSGSGDRADGSFGATSILAIADSEYARSRTVSTIGGSPASPTRSSARAMGSDSIELSWVAAGDRSLIAGHAIERAAAETGPYQRIASLGADAASYLDTDLASDTEYWYRVAAIGESGTSGFSSASARTKRVTLPRPTGLTIQARGDLVIIVWEDRARDEEGYVLERRDPGVATYKVVARLEANRAWFVDDAYIEDGRYHYRVKAVFDRADSPWASGGVSVFRSFRSDVSIYMPFTINRR